MNSRTIMLCTLAAVVLSSCQLNSSLLHQKKEKQAVRVKTLEITPSASVCRNSYMGEAASSKTVTLTSPFSGTLTGFNVSKGSRVSTGAVVARISSQSVESAYKIAQADLEQARDAMARVGKVYGSGSVSEVQMMDIQTKLEKAEASMQSAAKAMDDCSVKAPFSGVVSEIFPNAGEDLSVGARLMTIVDVSDLKLNISVHENEIGRINVGAAALADIPALHVTGAPARVIEKGVMASSATHSYLCALKLKEKPDGLMPGMVVKVYFESDSDKGHIVVPASAVQLDSEGKYVWVSDSCVVMKRRVAIDGYEGKGVIISEGLEYGDKVITEGYQKVSGGMKVCETE